MQQQAAQPIPDLEHWPDLFIQEEKRAGFVGLANENYQMIAFYGCNDFHKLLAATQGIPDRFITLNAFGVQDWKSVSTCRNTANMRQIRNIGVDIDQYDLGLSIKEAESEIIRLIGADEIPMPNLIAASRGIQLFYSIEGGASPKAWPKASHITRQLIQKLSHIGADSNAKDAARLMRAPGSINSRNGALVSYEIWEAKSYTLDGLAEFVGGYTPKKKSGSAPVSLPESKAVSVMRQTNLTIINDLERLAEIRQYDLTHMRNIFFYNLAYRLALTGTDLEITKRRIHALFSKVTTQDKRGQRMTIESLDKTIESAQKNAADFSEWLHENEYRNTYEAGAGIIKPKRAETIIRELKITDQEKQQLEILTTKEKRVERKRQRETERNREKGIRPMAEYLEDRKERRRQNAARLEALMKEKPGYTQKQYADCLGLAQSTVSALIKQIREGHR